MRKYIVAAIALATLLIGNVTLTVYEDVDGVHELSLNRLLSPTNLIGEINSKVNITASWDAIDSATAYIIEFYKKGPNCEGTSVFFKTIEGTEFTKEGLEGETEYTIRIESIAEGLSDSKQGVIPHTTGVIERILKTIEDASINNKTATIKWTTGEAVTKLQLSWVDKDKKTQKATLKVSEAEVAADQKVLTDLIPSTTYEIRIKSDEGIRGIRIFTTKAGLTTVIQVHNGDGLTVILGNVREGAYIVIMDNAKYTAYVPDDDVKTYTLNKSLTISGYYSSNRLVIKGCITIGSSVKTLELSNVILSGEKKAGGLLIIGEGPAEIETFKVDGYDISSYKNSVTNNESKVNIGSMTIQNSAISSIGRDVIDIRGGKLKSIEVSACTLNNAAHTFLRNNSSSIVTISSTQYIFYKVYHLDNKGNNGLFLMDKITDNSRLIVKQCLFYSIEMEELGDDKYVGTWTRSDKMKASGTYANNYYYDSSNLWTDSKYAKDYFMVATEASPQFIGAENGGLTVGNKELIGSEIDGPRWLK